MKPAIPLVLCAVAGCTPTGATPRVVGSQVQPGLAVCLATIGRADVAVVPEAPMSDAEIAALVDCTAERAAR